MILELTTITQDKEWRDFYCQLNDITDAFDLLNRIAQGGDTLFKAQVIENNRTIPLPLELFTQPQYTNPIHELKQQWEMILSQPVVYTPSKDVSSQTLNQQLVSLKQDHINELQDTLSYMYQLLEISQQILKEGTRKTKLISQYQLTIDRCNRSLARIQGHYVGRS